MGIFDKAKNQIQDKLKGFGEETIRNMDALDEEKPAKVREIKERTPKPKKPVIKKTPKPSDIASRFSRTKGIQSKKEEDVLEEDNFFEEEIVEEKEDNSSAFDTSSNEEDRNFIKEQKKKHEKKMKAYEAVPVPVPDDGKIQDVLEILRIPATFEIESDIFLPEDLDETGFNIQVPQGYDMGEVDTFVSRVMVSVSKYVELLKLRNEHVAQLATVVDRLQVDVSNIKLQSEIANGINIMPTNDSDDYEQENFELKLIIKRLEEQLETKDDSLSSDERDTFDKLQDELSLKTREMKDLEDEIYELKNQLAMKEEDGDFDTYVEDDGESDFASDTNDDYNDLYVERPSYTEDDLYGNTLEDNYYTEDTPLDSDIEDNETILPALEDENYGIADDNGSYSSEEASYSDFGINDDDNEEYTFGEDILEDNGYESDEQENNEGLPDISLDGFYEDDDPIIESHAPQSGNNAFYTDDEPLNDFMVRNQQYYTGPEDDSSIDLLDDSGDFSNGNAIGTYYDPDEEEDAIERLQEWGKNQ